MNAVNTVRKNWGNVNCEPWTTSKEMQMISINCWKESYNQAYNNWCFDMHIFRQNSITVNFLLYILVRSSNSIPAKLQDVTTSLFKGPCMWQLTSAAARTKWTLWCRPSRRVSQKNKAKMERTDLSVFGHCGHFWPTIIFKCSRQPVQTWRQPPN